MRANWKFKTWKIVNINGHLVSELEMAAVDLEGCSSS